RAELSVTVERAQRDFVAVAHRFDAGRVELAAAWRAQVGGLERGGGLGVAVVCGQARDQLERGVRDAIAFGPLDGVAFAGARAPADPDRELVAMRLEGDRDVVDERA